MAELPTALLFHAETNENRDFASVDLVSAFFCGPVIQCELQLLFRSGFPFSYSSQMYFNVSHLDLGFEIWNPNFSPGYRWVLKVQIVLEPVIIVLGEQTFSFFKVLFDYLDKNLTDNLLLNRHAHIYKGADSKTRQMGKKHIGRSMMDGCIAERGVNTLIQRD